MEIGSLVQYTVREGEPPVPAIVMGIWPDNTIQLYVFHFEAVSHVRAAHPSQVAEPPNPLQDDIEALKLRVEALEIEAVEPEAVGVAEAGVESTSGRKRRSWPKKDEE
jgi:hypothetical protein